MDDSGVRALWDALDAEEAALLRELAELRSGEFAEPASALA